MKKLIVLGLAAVFGCVSIGQSQVSARASVDKSQILAGTFIWASTGDPKPKQSWWNS